MIAAVEAVQFTEDMAEGREPLPCGVVKRRDALAGTPPPGSGLLVYARFFVRTAHGQQTVNVGDWLVTMPTGGVVVCPPDAFAEDNEREA